MMKFALLFLLAAASAAVATAVPLHAADELADVDGGNRGVALARRDGDTPTLVPAAIKGLVGPTYSGRRHRKKMGNNRERRRRRRERESAERMRSELVDAGYADELDAFEDDAADPLPESGGTGETEAPRKRHYRHHPGNNRRRRMIRHRHRGSTAPRMKMAELVDAGYADELDPQTFGSNAFDDDAVDPPPAPRSADEAVVPRRKGHHRHHSRPGNDRLRSLMRHRPMIKMAAKEAAFADDEAFYDDLVDELLNGAEFEDDEVAGDEVDEDGLDGEEVVDLVVEDAFDGE
ncbi:hypothetical protein DFJ73DRAFT_861224 [Zopfochytrium polystomum]|nr:hypothetical protein DFJ73DRAFT_861224 [Zopfochytrium polystomum]